MASAVNPITSPSASSGASSTSSSASSAASLSAPSEEMFLQLLVAQLQNQDPLNPTDSTQFVSQLAQFSQLEQTISIRGDIESYHAEAAAASTATDPSSGSSSTSGANSTTGSST